jgi:hypothetical protein
MAWGIVMAFPMVFGMLMLIFAANGEGEYQTFGRIAVNEPDLTETDAEDVELKKAA